VTNPAPEVTVTVTAPTFADTFKAVDNAADTNGESANGNAQNTQSPAANNPAPQSQPMTMDVFKQLDSDTSNSLSIDELNQRYDNIDFNEADLNNDGLIDEKEFKKLIKEMEKGNDEKKSVSQILDESTHILESAPRYAEAFQSPLQRALNDLLVF